MEILIEPHGLCLVVDPEPEDHVNTLDKNDGPDEGIGGRGAFTRSCVIGQRLPIISCLAVVIGEDLEIVRV